jgi:hypothetical protein
MPKRLSFQSTAPTNFQRIAEDLGPRAGIGARVAEIVQEVTGSGLEEFHILVVRGHLA